MKANHDQIKRYLHVVQGQLNGIENMINNDDYCIDISNQVMASIALLKKINEEILTAHLKSCLLNASSKEEQEIKVDEITKLIKRM